MIVKITGKGFVLSLFISCKFGTSGTAPATYINLNNILCLFPKSLYHYSKEGLVEVSASNNGKDFTTEIYYLKSN